MLIVSPRTPDGHAKAGAAPHLGLPAEIRSGENGFTLLEVIVALAVLAISLTLALRTISGGVYYQQQARTLADATALAQSLLARIGGDLPLRQSVESGALANGLGWQVQIEPYGSASERREWPVAAYAVSVRIVQRQNAEKPVYVLETLRLGPRESRQ